MSDSKKKYKDRSALAAELINASTQAERTSLLRRFPELVDLQLANQIKELCYESWTSEPTIARRVASALGAIEKRLPSQEIKAIMYWARGISDLTKGRLESAVLNLVRSADLFRAEGNIGESARSKVATLMALAMLGRYDEAVRTGNSALKIFLTIGDELAAGKIELNLSNIASRRGRHRESEKQYLSAIKRFSELGERKWKTMAENGLATTYAEIGEIRQAEKYYKSSLKTARSGGMLVTEAEIEASIGNLCRSRGQYREALGYLELSREKYERLGMPHQSAIAELEIADIYSELNLYPEALEAYERLIPVLAKLKLRAEEARARTNFGRVLHSANRTRDARRQLRTAIRLYRLEENRAGEALALIVTASIDNARGKLAAAEESVRSAESLLDGLQSPRRTLNAAWLRAEIKRKSGQAAAAVNSLEKILLEAKLLNDPTTEIAALCSFARIAAEQGDSNLAASGFRKAITIVESLRAPLPGEEFRRAIVADKMGPYNDLAQLYIAEGKLRRAFQLVERSRSRSLDELIENNQSAVTKATNTFAELRERLNWNYSRHDKAEGVELVRLRAESGKLERQLAEFRRRQQSIVAPRSGVSLKIAAKQVDVATIQTKLGRRRGLIEYVSFEGEVGAFVLTDRSLHFLKGLVLLRDLELLVDELTYQFSSLRFGAANLGSFASILKKKTDNVLHKLHQKLIGPLTELIGGRDLVISPSEILNYVPFAALYDGSKYLIESREVVHAPSGSIWLEMTRRRRRTLEPGVLIGFADESIPLVDDEVAALAKLLPSSVVRTGDDASFDSFKVDGSSAGLLHVACHGRFRPDNPMYSSLHLSDGWVTVNDILGMKLNAELVSLSACETGINKIYPGEEIVGLARGFLAAGAANVILSLWKVNDKATGNLMVDLYSSLQRDRSIAASLRWAQRNFIERGEHPYFWAPFILIGR